MKLIFLLGLLAGITGVGFIAKKKSSVKKSTAAVQPVNGMYKPVAVLELFTSEGCSSCPPADRLLPQLAQLDSNVFPLSFHVDYWNRLGWTDPFSNEDYTERQRNYVQQLHLESAYTPQLVVNGEYEMVGSDRNEAVSAIHKALQEKAPVQLTVADVNLNNDQLGFTVHTAGDIANTNIVAALVQRSATMDVKAGENRGAQLSHTNVVRTMLMKKVAANDSFQLSVPAGLTGNWQLIVYAQRTKDLHITGAIAYLPKM